MHYSSPLFHKVLFVAGSDAVEKDLAEIIAHKKNFFLETYSHFETKLFRAGDLEKTKTPTHGGNEGDFE